MSHFEHLKGFFPSWVLSFFFKLSACENVFIHLEDWNSFSSESVLSLVNKWPDFEKLLSHFEHLKGFSPVCVLSSPSPSRNLILKKL